MAYDDSSFYGDLLCYEYDEQNNFMNPQSSFGFLVYYLLGGGFDMMSDMCNKFLNDLSLLSADSSSLDKFWGVSYGMPRPKLYVGTENERYLTDDEYRVYLYLRNCRLMTRQDIEVNMNKCFALDDYDCYFSEESVYLNATDHRVYTPATTPLSNIAKNISDTSKDFIISSSEQYDDVHSIEGNLSESTDRLLVINVPFQNWDSTFLAFMEQYISVKGNLRLKEYKL